MQKLFCKYNFIKYGQRFNNIFFLKKLSYIHLIYLHQFTLKFKITFI